MCWLCSGATLPLAALLWPVTELLHTGSMTTARVQQLRDLHDQGFSAEHDWSAHLRSLNNSLGLVGPHELATPAPGLPPSWFVGDVESLQPGRWVLFVGLNQARSPQDEDWHLAQGYSAQTYWDYWRLLNNNSWYGRYYAPRVRLASAALGVEVPREREQEFATMNMVFVELCPYSSRKFGLPDTELLRLSAEDHGFRIAAQMRRILIEEGRPAVVMVSGGNAVTVLERLEEEQLTLEERRSYQSVSRPEKRLWHREGYFSRGESRVPAIGFPFLRTQSTHNSYDEIDQLGARARVLVRDSPR